MYAFSRSDPTRLVESRRNLTNRYVRSTSRNVPIDYGAVFREENLKMRPGSKISILLALTLLQEKLLKFKLRFKAENVGFNEN